MFKDTLSDHQKAVAIHDSALIISLYDLKEPVLWRFSLSQMHEASFTVKALKDGQFILVLAQQKEEKILGHFIDKEHAKNILNDIQQSLTSYTAQSQSCKNSWWISGLKWGGIVLAVIFLLLLVVGYLLPEDNTDAELEQLLSTLAQQQQVVESGSADIPAGQPVDADAFFGQFEE